MSLLATLGFFGVAVYFGWMICVRYVVQLFRDREPSLYAQIGAPSGAKAWSRPFGSPELDSLILRRQFRALPIKDHALRRLLEVAYCLRWLLLVSVVLFAFALLASAVGGRAP